ncbi:MAG: RsmB/NOP family class I SAM-dependent RNA methyltransferase [Anaerolineales bacterium]|nr:RsmB/NOP family class I SAM-dependent RNA methyltransferase [Anaerolineales bacterium]
MVVGVHLRVNTLVNTVPDCAARLQAAGFTVQPLDWCPEALTVPGATARNLTGLPDYERGAFFIQNHASLLPVLALDPQPGEKVLDLCAAPGGKTTHIAARMQNRGEIVANDLSRQRVYRLANVLRQFGVTCARTTRMPGHLLWQRYPNYFDRALVDAPCSMRGTADPSSSSVRSLAKQQRFLLKSALSATRPGGVIVYSTCTITAEENEAVLAWLLEKHPGLVVVEPFDVPGAPLAPALTHDAQGRPFPEDIAHARRVPPSEMLEGFFIARLRKATAD